MIRITCIAGVALLAATAIPASAQDGRFAAVPADGTVLEILATGETARTPDLAVIQAGVVTQSPTAAQALSTNNSRMTRVIAALRAAGVAERDVQTATISLSPQYRYAENRPPVITGYQASNQVTVRFRDIARAGPILDVLVREGANTIDGPNLTIEKPETALDEARTSAIVQARGRADTYARAAGLRVDRILSISEASTALPPMPVRMRGVVAEAAAQSSVPIAAGEQQLSVSVSVRFLLK
jgi:uncharacterized protein YggE